MAMIQSPLLLALAYNIVVTSRSRGLLLDSTTSEVLSDVRLIAGRRLIEENVPSRHAIHAVLFACGAGDRADALLPWLGESLEIALKCPILLNTFSDAAPSFGRRIDTLIHTQHTSPDLDNPSSNLEAMMIIAAVATLAETGATVFVATVTALCARACFLLKNEVDSQELTCSVLLSLTRIVTLIAGGSSSTGGDGPAAMLLSRRTPKAVASDTCAIIHALVIPPLGQANLQGLSALLRARLENGAAVLAPRLPACGEDLIAAVLDAIVVGNS